VIPAPQQSRNAQQGAVLEGLRIVLTRPREHAGDFERAIQALGGRPEIAPAIAIAPPERSSDLDSTLDRIHEFDWIAFTSANAVRALARRADARSIPRARLAAVKLAALGEATASAIANELRAPDAVAETASGLGLGRELPDPIGARVLVPHGDLAGEALGMELRRRGAEPIAVVAYRTIPGDGIPTIVAGWREGTIAALLFASGSAVRFVADAIASDRSTGAWAGHTNPPAIFCIGQSTAQAAVLAGLMPDGIAAEATQRALIDEVARWFAARRFGSA
jgi:uroporphyrinogen III methyltransferase/synthase